MKINLKNKLSILGLACGVIFSGFASARSQDGIFELTDRELRIYGNTAADEFSTLMKHLTLSELLEMRRSMDGGYSHTLHIQTGRLGNHITMRSARSIEIISGEEHSLGLLAKHVHSNEALLFKFNGGVALVGSVADGLMRALERAQSSNRSYYCEFVKFRSPAYPGQGFNACAIFP